MNQYFRFFIVLLLLSTHLTTWAVKVPPIQNPVKEAKSACWQEILDANRANVNGEVDISGTSDGSSTYPQKQNLQNGSMSYENTWDKDNLQIRQWNEDKLKKYQKEKDFTYKPETAPKIDTKIPQPKADSGSGSNMLWNLLIITAVIFVIGGIVWSVFRGQMPNILSAAQPIHAQTELIEEDIKKNDFKSLITNSVQEKDYRKAVRMLYLEALKILTINNWIIWKQHKTNHDYLAELSLSPFKKPFEELTRHFEYVWYGQVPMNEELFATTQAVFNDFKSQVKPK